VTSATPAKTVAAAGGRYRRGDKGSQSIVITPPGRFRLPSITQLWEAREVFTSFGRRDITLRYRQTALGVIWVVLQPLLAAGIFTLVFGGVARLPTGGVPYFAFSFAGMLAWNVISGIIVRAAPALVSSQALISRVFFPRIVVPLSTTCSVLVDFAVAFCMMIVLLVVYRINPGWPIALTPIWVISAVLLGGGAGTAFSALMVKFRDIQYIVPVVVQLLLYATPVAYSVDAVPDRYRLFFDLNPLSWLLQDFHWSLLGGARPPAWQMAGSAGVAILVFFAGTVIFEQMERGFADVI
jgi:lipopolysaccharide transport system permease protein